MQLSEKKNYSILCSISKNVHLIFTILRKKITLTAYLFLNLQTAKNAVRQKSRQSIFLIFPMEVELENISLSDKWNLKTAC